MILSRSQRRTGLATVAVVIPLLFGCSFVSPLFTGDEPPEITPAGGSVPATATSVSTPTPTPETMTVFTLEEGTIEVPVPPPDTWSDLLEQNVEEGIWERGEGFVFLLSYLAGEQEPEQIPGFELVTEPSPTGLLRQAFDYLEAPDRDPEYAAEIERLLAELVPSQEDLDRFSEPADESDRGAVHLIAAHSQADVPAECATIGGEGFSAEVDTGEHCYIYKESAHSDGRLRVYYPKWWQDEDDKVAIVDATMEALAVSAPIYSNLGTFQDVNAVFSLSQPADMNSTLAYEVGFSADDPCPITVLPLGSGSAIEAYKQTIAHEAFHCFQDWNFTMSPYSVHKWWAEGSAEYFSNVVYPTTNDEHGWLGSYYSRSIRQPWFDMSYHNFLLFQYFGNELGDPGVISLLESVSSSGSIAGQAATLGAYPSMEEMFEDFVVATMSVGVADTGGGMIALSPIPLIRVEPVDQEGEEEFSIDPFVAGRFGVRYKQERRFLQDAVEDEFVRHSAAIAKQRRDPNAWSELAPEVRSHCEEDELYALAITAVRNSGTFKANVTLMEEAECDPCLLGTWNMDTDSFEAFLNQLMAEYGANQFPGGGSVSFEIGPHQYVHFDEDGEMTSRRVDFDISFSSAGAGAIELIIDAQGRGEYSADGEELNVTGLSQQTNSVQFFVDGVAISGTLGPDLGTYNFFGNTTTGPGLPGSSDGPQSASGQYVCGEDTLEITLPEGGPVLFDRVDEIIPTAVPTPGR